MKAREKEDEFFLKSLGERITAVRKGKGMTQVELGYRSDIEKPHVRRLEAGTSNPTVLTIKRICSGLEITPEQLFKDMSI